MCGGHPPANVSGSTAAPEPPGAVDDAPAPGLGAAASNGAAELSAPVLALHRGRSMP
jgi:hypothetical protein